MPSWKLIVELVKQDRRQNKLQKERTAAEEREYQKQLQLHRKAKPLVERAVKMRSGSNRVRGRMEAIRAAQDAFIGSEVTDSSIRTFKSALDKIDRDYPLR